MERMRDYAKRLGVCKKTALAHARRAGLHVEKRPVRGGWAWFVDVEEADGTEASGASKLHALDARTLARCIATADLACKFGLPAERKATFAAVLYHGVSQ